MKLSACVWTVIFYFPHRKQPGCSYQLFNRYINKDLQHFVITFLTRAIINADLYYVLVLDKIACYKC